MEVAQDFFRQKFEDKTNKSKTNIINTWEGRKNFQKVPGKYELVNIEIEDKNGRYFSCKSDVISDGHSV